MGWDLGWDEVKSDAYTKKEDQNKDFNVEGSCILYRRMITMTMTIVISMTMTR